jgi:hypothetical protein
VGQQVAAVCAHVLREVEGRGLPGKRDAVLGTAGWLRQRWRISTGTAHRLVELSRALDRLPQLDAALSTAEVNVEQAAVIAAAVHDLPADVGADTAARAEQALVGMAAEFAPTALRKLGGRILAHVDPGTAERAEGERLRRDAERAYRRRGLSLTDAGAGLVRVTVWLDAEAAAIITAALDPLCTPTRHRPTHQPAT